MVAVVVEHGGDAASVAAPIAGRILTRAFGARRRSTTLASKRCADDLVPGEPVISAAAGRRRRPPRPRLSHQTRRPSRRPHLQPRPRRGTAMRRLDLWLLLADPGDRRLRLPRPDLHRPGPRQPRLRQPTARLARRRRRARAALRLRRLPGAGRASRRCSTSSRCVVLLALLVASRPCAPALTPGSSSASYTVQPSEFARVATILAVAALAGEHRQGRSSLEAWPAPGGDRRAARRCSSSLSPTSAWRLTYAPDPARRPVARRPAVAGLGRPRRSADSLVAGRGVAVATSSPTRRSASSPSSTPSAIRTAPATSSASRRSPSAPAASPARGCTPAPSPSSASCPRSTPTSSSPSGPRRPASSAPRRWSRPTRLLVARIFVDRACRPAIAPVRSSPPRRRRPRHPDHRQRRDGHRPRADHRHHPAAACRTAAPRCWPTGITLGIVQSVWRLRFANV